MLVPGRADHGARVVTVILNDPVLKADWMAELEEVRLTMLSLREQLANAVQHASTKQQASEPVATAPDRHSLSNLFLDVSRKLGKLATSQMDELAQKHLGKPLDELLDGSAVRKSLFETLKAFNEKLDNQNAQSAAVQQENQRQQYREQLRQRREVEEQQRLQRQEQERERKDREHQRIVQLNQQRLREQQHAEQQRLHLKHQREIRRQQEEHESAAKSIAKNLHERAKAAKREMRRFHNEL